MEKETSSLVSLGIVLIAIAVVITLGFGIFAVGKRLANNGQNDVVSQVDQINSSTFTDLDQQVVTGTRLKGVISQLSTGNYAVLINTLALRNCYVDGTKVSGDLVAKTGSTLSFNPSYKDAIVWSNFPTTTSKGKACYATFINYNALLGDATGQATNPTIGRDTDPTFADTANGRMINAGGDPKGTWMLDAALLTDATETPADSPSATKYLRMIDGIFTTEHEFQTDSATGTVLKNNRASDFTKQGTTMYIADGAQFGSYVIKDSTDNYVGLAFVQIQK